MNLTGYEVYDAYGVERIKLDGEYTPESLAELLVEKWIPYFECHQCGKSDYCKYTVPHPHNPDKQMDIKCGVAVDALKNYVKHSFHLLENMDGTQIQDYLDAAYYFVEFVRGAEQMIGVCIDQESLTWLDSYAHGTIASINRLGEHLIKLRHHLKDIPEFRVKREILLVEGQAEERFLSKLRRTHQSHLLHLIVDTYAGEGNLHAKRVEMLFSKLRSEGYEIFLQGDADNNNQRAAVESLVQKGFISKEDTFIFNHDFETAFPPGLLLAALQDLGELSEVTLEDFNEEIYSEDISVVKYIKKAFL